MTQVEVRRFGDGSYSLGALIEGEFVPFVSHPKGRVEQYVERGQTLRGRAEGGDAGAVDALGEPVADTRPKAGGR